MRIKTAKLTGTALDWAVAKIEGVLFPRSIPKYSSDWAQGGPIIEREKIRLDCEWSDGPWKGCCKIDGETWWVEGETPLIAAMRCYVISKLGDEVDIPEELLK